MGYILPISNHGYIEYQKRMEKSPQDPHYIEKPFKVILEIQHEDLGAFPEDKQLTMKKAQKQNVRRDLQQHQRIYGMLTGRGTVINESV